jgi:hypothetical protein
MNKLILDRQQELGFMSRTLAQISLPHSKLDANYFERSNGLITLSVTTTNRKIGLPYGTYPRLLLAWMCSEAVKTQTPTLHLGSNQSEFLRKLNLSRDGRYIAALKEQSNRLLSSVFRIDFTDKSLRGFKHLLLADGFELWEPTTGEWEAHIKLTTDFFNEVVSNPVPLDLNVLHAIRKSPMQMDVYTWLVYRTYSIYATGNRPAKISWADLQTQFGANYGALPNESSDFLLTAPDLQKIEQQGLRDFKKRFIKSLVEIKQYYPELGQVLSADSQFLTIGGAKLIK